MHMSENRICYNNVFIYPERLFYSNRLLDSIAESRFIDYDKLAINWQLIQLQF